MIIPTFGQQIEILLVLLLIAVSVIVVSFSVSKSQFGKKVDCQPEKFWGPWSECTRNCAGGNQYRTRAIEQMARHGGANCPQSDILQSQSCNDNIPCGINCVPGNPANFQWTPCPKCTKDAAQPIQYKTVIPVREATYMGQDCDIDSVIMSRECTNIPPCPPDIDCQITEYTRSTCNVPCGSGTLNVFSRITRLPSGDGAPCDLGDLVSQEACSLGPCGCEGLSWSGTFSECNAACGPGIQIMMRAPTVDENPGFCPYVSVTACSLTECPNSTCTAPSVDFVQALCYMQCAGLPFPEIDQNICFSQDILDAVCGINVGAGLSYDNAGCEEPRDCSLTSFSDFGACSIQSCLASEPFGGTRTRIRTIVQPGNSGGQSCLDQVFEDVEPCLNLYPVSYSSFDINTNQFILSVSSPQCSNAGCSLSDWFSITGFLGGCGPCSQEWIRSLSFVGNIDQCPTDPSLFYSLSSCCGKSPSARNQTTCGALPACVQCQWQDIRDFPFKCTGVSGTRTLYRDMVLVSNTNNPLQNCQTTDAYECDGSTASNPSSLAPFYGNSIYSCSKYFFSCTTGGGPGECPVGCNGQQCSGYGVPSYTTYTGGVSCTCDCYDGFSGPNCEILLDRCPIASLSELECNGLGTCSTVTSSALPFTCTCDNRLDTTADCTGSSTAWCWIYGNARGNFIGGASTLNNLNKVLGVIPIASTSNYGFSEEDCINIDTITFDDGYKESFSYLPAKPLFIDSQQTRDPPIVNRLGFTGRIQSRIPYTLASDLTAFCLDMNPNLSTYQLLLQSIGYEKAQYFIPRYLPFSSPALCESLFTLRLIDGLPTDYYNDSQLNLASSVTGPFLQNYYTQSSFSSWYSLVADSTWESFNQNNNANTPASCFQFQTTISQINIPEFYEGQLVTLTIGGSISQTFKYESGTLKPGDVSLGFTNSGGLTTISGLACGISAELYNETPVQNYLVLTEAGLVQSTNVAMIGLIFGTVLGPFIPLTFPLLPDRTVIELNAIFANFAPKQYNLLVQNEYLTANLGCEMGDNWTTTNWFFNTSNTNVNLPQPNIGIAPGGYHPYFCSTFNEYINYINIPETLEINLQFPVSNTVEISYRARV